MYGIEDLGRQMLFLKILKKTFACRSHHFIESKLYERTELKSLRKDFIDIDYFEMKVH